MRLRSKLWHQWNRNNFKLLTDKQNKFIRAKRMHNNQLFHFIILFCSNTLWTITHFQGKCNKNGLWQWTTLLVRIEPPNTNSKDPMKSKWVLWFLVHVTSMDSCVCVFLPMCSPWPRFPHSLISHLIHLCPVNYPLFSLRPHEARAFPIQYFFPLVSRNICIHIKPQNRHKTM